MLAGASSILHWIAHLLHSNLIQNKDVQEGNINSSSHSWHVVKKQFAFESGNKDDSNRTVAGRSSAGYERQGQFGTETW